MGAAHQTHVLCALNVKDKTDVSIPSELASTFRDVIISYQLYTDICALFDLYRLGEIKVSLEDKNKICEILLDAKYLPPIGLQQIEHDADQDTGCIEIFHPFDGVVPLPFLCLTPRGLESLLCLALWGASRVTLDPKMDPHYRNYILGGYLQGEQKSWDSDWVRHLKGPQVKPLLDLLSKALQGLPFDDLSSEKDEHLFEILYGQSVFESTRNIGEGGEYEGIPIKALVVPLPTNDDDDDLLETHKDPLIQHLTKVASLDEFRIAFIGAIEAHHRLYQETGTAFGDLTPHNLIFLRDERDGQPAGVFVDCEPMISAPELLAPRRNSLSVPFQAHDLISNPRSETHYRSDLESFFYILLWYAICNTFADEKMSTHPVGVRYADQWFSVTWNFTEVENGDYRWSQMKRWRNNFISDRVCQFNQISKDFKSLEDTWLEPLWKMFSDAHSSSKVGRLETLATRLTFESFMAAIGRT